MESGSHRGGSVGGVKGERSRVTSELLVLDWLCECSEMCWDEPELSPQHKIEGRGRGRRENQQAEQQHLPPSSLSTLNSHSNLLDSP